MIKENYEKNNYRSGPGYGRAGQDVARGSINTDGAMAAVH